MKNKTINPTRSQLSILRQICNFIPPHEVSKIARETGAEDKSRTFKPWSHVVSLVYAQLTHGIGLNDLCDSLQLHSGPLSSVRGATAPSRNGLSNANRERPAEMAEQLFWRVMDHLGQQSPGFVTGRPRGAAFRFKMPIHVVDTTVIELVANCMDWASQQLLAEYAANGSESAFRERVGCYINLVYSTALRLVDGDTALAQDVTQTVFISLARKGRTLSGAVMLGGCLQTVSPE